MNKDHSQSNDALQSIQNSSQNEIILYRPNDTISLNVRLENETVWLTQIQIAELFGVKQPAISKHISNIYSSGELSENGTYSILEYMGNDGRQKYITKYYNLDVILSVGYRVNSVNATRFRQWANKVLKEYLLRGYAVNQRVNQLEDKVDRRFADYDQKIEHLNQQVDFFVKTSLPPKEKVFFDGQLFDAHILMSQLVESAEKRIVLIDNYIDESVLTLLLKRKRNVEATVYTVTFDANGGVLTGESTFSVEENTVVTKPADPTKQATAEFTYEFAGWLLNGVAYDFDTAVTGDITLIADWTATKNTYTVTFDSNGGTTVASQTVEYGLVFTEPVAPTKEATAEYTYTFNGWLLDGVAYDFDSKSTIHIDVADATNETTGKTEIEITGVLGVMFSKYACGVNQFNRRVTTHYNAKAEFYNNYYKTDANYWNALDEDFVVFFIADPAA